MNTPTLEEYELATSKQEYWIGSGGDRHGYHIPGSRWIYKVERDRKRSTNLIEYANYLKVKALCFPEQISIPEMHLLDNGVIAAEYIDGERPFNRCEHYFHENMDGVFPDAHLCWGYWISNFTKATKLYDAVSLCNMRLIKDATGKVIKVYLIDLGE